MSYYVISYNVIPDHVKPYYVISYNVIPDHVMSYYVISYNVIPDHVKPYYVISYNVIPDHVMSYYVISYNVIPDHVMSYCHFVGLPSYARACDIVPCHMSCPMVPCHMVPCYLVLCHMSYRTMSCGTMSYCAGSLWFSNICRHLTYRAPDTKWSGLHAWANTHRQTDKHIYTHTYKFARTNVLKLFKISRTQRVMAIRGAKSGYYGQREKNT